MDPYKNIKINVYLSSSVENKDYIVDVVGEKSSENSLPYYNIRRAISHEILSNYQNEVFTVVVGRRFSGKTFLAKQLVQMIADRDCYFLPSTVSVNNEILSSMLNKRKSVFIFDTSSLSLENINFLDDNHDSLKSNDIKVIIFMNKGDSLLSAMALRMTHNNYYTLTDKLSNDEILELNTKLSKSGLVESLRNKTFLDNCYRYNEIYGCKLKLNESDLSDDSLLILIVLATEGKFYSTCSMYLTLIERKC